MNIKFCRICKKKIKLIIDLGKICLVGDFKSNKKIQKKYKISLNYCKKCKHVQISEHIKPDLLFKNYLWETGVSKSNLTLIENYLKIFKKLKIKKNSKLLEVASNDGTFVKKIYNFFKCKVVGVVSFCLLANSLPVARLFFSIGRRLKRFRDWYNSTRADLDRHLAGDSAGALDRRRFLGEPIPLCRSCAWDTGA